MSKSKEEKVTKRILRGVTFSVEGSVHTFVPGEEDDLEAYMTPEQAERLVKEEAIEGDWEAAGKADDQQPMRFSPKAFGMARSKGTNRRAPAWAQDDAAKESKAAETRAAEHKAATEAKAADAKAAGHRAADHK